MKQGLIPLLVLWRLAAPQEPLQELAIGEVQVLELRAEDPPLEDRGPMRKLRWSSTSRGTLFVHVSAEGSRPLLLWESSEGKEVERAGDDQEKTTPCLVRDLLAGETIYVVVAAPDRERPCRVRLVAHFAVETDATLGAVEAADQALAEASERRAGADLDGARAALRRAIGLLRDVAGGEWSAKVQLALHRVASEANRSADDATGIEALELARARYAEWLPHDHRELQRLRQNLASFHYRLGDSASARSLLEEALAVAEATLLPEDDLLQNARAGVASLRAEAGDLQGSRRLEESVLEVYLRTLPEDHRRRISVQTNLSATLFKLGDAHAARTLLERSVETLTRTWPPEDRDLLTAQVNLSSMLREMGDLPRARAIAEQVFEVRSRVLPEDHPELQIARSTLSLVLDELGERDQSLALQEKVLEVYERTLPEDHIDLLRARSNLASTLFKRGKLEPARELCEGILEVLRRVLPPSDERTLLNLGLLAAVLYEQGDIAGARAVEEEEFVLRSATWPEDHPDVVNVLRRLSGSRAACGDWDGAFELAQPLSRGLRSWLARAALTLSPRETEEVAVSADQAVSALICLASSHPRSEAAAALNGLAFSAIESARAIGLRGARLSRQLASTAGSPEIEALWRRASECRAEAARLAVTAGPGADYVTAVSQRDQAERTLLARIAATEGGARALEEVDASSLASRLEEGEVAVGYWHSDCSLGDPAKPETMQTAEDLRAYVVASSGALARIDLGPIAVIEAAVDRWRSALLAPVERGITQVKDRTAAQRETGEALRRLVIDPLLPALGEARTIIVALDEPLHAVPLDALPAEEGVVGDRWQLRLRAWLAGSPASSHAQAPGGSLLAFGGIDYEHLGEEPREKEAPQDIAGGSQAFAHGAGAPTDALRGGPWERGFTPLPESRSEVRAILEVYARAFEGEGRDSVVLEGGRATRRALAGLAPDARWIHLATHGFFAPESVHSTADRTGRDWGEPSASGHLFASAEKRVRGLSPLVLCGLALSGANRPPDVYGRLSGLITAEELSGFDLTGCELAVLSACDTNVGVRRAGQGVASLQKALHMAGARSVITSLWKVNDEAARALMVDFYRRLWVEKKPKHRALWEAKLRLRSERDERGQSVYEPRDWAGWVLTGE